MLEELGGGAGLAEMVEHAEAGHGHGMMVGEGFGHGATEAAGHLCLLGREDGAGFARTRHDGDAIERLHDGGVVARADLDPGRNLEAADDALDERVFAEFSYGGIGHEDRRKLTPRFAVWGGRMNLLKQVEPL